MERSEKESFLQILGRKARFCCRIPAYSSQEPFTVGPGTVVAHLQAFQCVKAEVKEVQSQASEIGISPSIQSLRVQASSSTTRTEKPCLTWEKVWKGTNFSSMERLILAKKSEFPEWLQKGNHLEGLCRKPCTAGTDLWKCSGVIRESNCHQRAPKRTNQALR